jgi:hypothetical protein
MGMMIKGASIPSRILLPDFKDEGLAESGDFGYLAGFAALLRMARSLPGKSFRISSLEAGGHGIHHRVIGLEVIDDGFQ